MSEDLIPIPSQTVGPYFRIGLAGSRATQQIAPPGVQGERVRLVVMAFDLEDEPIHDCLIEIWQANADGKYNHPDDTQDKPIDPAFRGFGRQATDQNGVCSFETIKPGCVPGPRGTLQAPHLAVSVFARGMLNRLPTRIYFEGDPANDADPILALVPKQRRGTLLAKLVGTESAGESGAWQFTIRFGGDRETVFFDV
jgi:protocatechuate 3,4-dioxygenase alpha subunit